MEFLTNLLGQIADILSRQLFMLGESPITVSQVIAAPLLVAVGLLIGKFVERRLSRRLLKKGHDHNLVLLLRRAFYVVMVILLLLLALSVLNVPLGAFTFISGAVAIGVGFGAQNIINNFISGWILMGERPIRIGDLVEFEGTLGTVETINTRSTRIRRLDGVAIVTPNSYLLENTVVNWTLVDNEIRTLVTVGVAYGSPVRRVHELITQAAEEHESVMKEPAPTVIFEEFGDNALIFDVFMWTHLRPGVGDLRRLRSDIRFRIEELFNENDIVVAFPQRDVHMDGELRVLSSGAPARGSPGAGSEPAVAHEEYDLAGKDRGKSS